MNEKHIGFLHPGLMGVSLAASAQNSGYVSHWVSAGRSAETRERAQRHGLVEVETLQELCATCSVIVSVCPPGAASDVARQVAACGFRGIYADVNAISPGRAKDIAKLMNDSGAQFVDGGIIGGPAWKPGTTWLYLSGEAADRIATRFVHGPLETQVIGEEVGKASALKMCFAANTKGATALLCAVVAAAEELGVRPELEKQWARRDPAFARNALASIARVTDRAWRFTGEMEEIAATFEDAGLPAGFHSAAVDIYERIAKFKDAETTPPVEEVLAALLKRDAK